MQTSDSRKRQVEAADVEALAEVLWAATVRGATAGEPLLHEEADNLAGAVLASGWLAADRARVRAETLAEVERGGMAMIRAERKRQVEVEGYTPDHDREHGGFVLAQAAAAYEFEGYLRWGTPTRWPWTPESWKPRDPISNLVRAGALFLAAHEQGYPSAEAGAERCAESIDAAAAALVRGMAEAGEPDA